MAVYQHQVDELAFSFDVRSFRLGYFRYFTRANKLRQKLRAVKSLLS